MKRATESDAANGRDDRRLICLERVWAGLLLMLLAATWRLWWPQPDFPAVPMLSVADVWQKSLSVLSLALVVAGCVGVVVVPSQRRWLWWLVSGGLLLAFVLDQHRLQPWAYQAAVYGIVFSLLDDRAARRWLIALLASVYVYSALGKFDFQFVHTVGQDFLRPALSLLGLDERLSNESKVKLAFVLPGLELAGGLGVLVQRSRRAAGCLLVAMHVTLVGLLGPLGFDHSSGVLLWNVLLAIAAWELFVRRPLALSTVASTQPSTAMAIASYGPQVRTWLVRLMAGFVLLMPLAERSGYWDHWPSWALYSPHNSRVKLQVHATELDALPLALTHSADGAEGWVDVDLEGWSFESRRVPLYPQARYQLALATKLAETRGLDDAVRCLVQGVSNRWTGQREEQVALGTDEMKRLLKEYWLVPASD